MIRPHMLTELWFCFRKEVPSNRLDVHPEVIETAGRLLVEWGSNRLAMREILATGVKLGEVDETVLVQWDALGSSLVRGGITTQEVVSTSSPKTRPPPREAQLALCLHASADFRGYGELQSHAAGLKKQSLLTFSSLLDLAPGKSLREGGLHLLESAAVVVALLSADLFADEWLFELVNRAFQRHQQGLLTMVLVCYRPVDLAAYGLDSLTRLPDNRIPVSVSHDPDTAWLAVVNGLRARLCRL